MSPHITTPGVASIEECSPDSPPLQSDKSFINTQTRSGTEPVYKGIHVGAQDWLQISKKATLMSLIFT